MHESHREVNKMNPRFLHAAVTMNTKSSATSTIKGVSPLITAVESWSTHQTCLISNKNLLSTGTATQPGRTNDSLDT